MNDLRTRLEASLSASYQLERELGSGGMAVVYLAHDLRHKRRVALKVLRPEVSAVIGPQRFLREIETLANLTHPHILPLHDSGEADGLLYYVMPFIEGESLRDRLLREKQLPLDDALRIAREVADALSHAHGRGVIHRDIKPENILFSGGHALVADFGIAAAIDVAGGNRLTETGIAVGTPAYMSPEQALGERKVDARSDIYALGCVLYEMLAGEVPFTGATAQVVMMRRLHEPVPSVRTIRERVPEYIDECITSALARLPADRLATAVQFAEAITANPVLQYRNTSPLGVNKQFSAVGPKIRPSRIPNRTLAVAGTITAVVTLAASLGLLMNSDSRLDPKRVAVAPFLNQGQESTAPFGVILSYALTSGLTQSGLMNVVPTPSVLFAAAAISGGQASFDPTALGEETGAGLIVHGNVFTIGDSLVIQPQIIDVTSGNALPALERIVVPAADTLASLKIVLDRVLVRLSSWLDHEFESPTTIRGLPSSMQAYTAFVDGMRHLHALEFVQARERFRRAVALDPAFIAARLWLVSAEWNADSNVPGADSLLQFVQPNRDALLPIDRATLDWQQAWVDGDLQEILDAAREMATLNGPARGGSAVQAALLLNRLDEAQRRMVIVLATSSGAGHAWNWQHLGIVLHMRGKHKRELREVRKGIRLTGQERELLPSEILALAAAGKVDELRERLDLAKRSGLIRGNSSAIFRAAANELRVHGRPREAEQVGRLAAQWYREALADSATWLTRFDLAATLFELGDAAADTMFAALGAEGLRTQFGQEHDRGYDAAALGYVGVIAAARGDTEEAQRISADLGRLQRPYLRGANKHWQARIAAALSQCEDAVQFLHAALAAGSPYWIYSYQSLKEIPQFARLSCPAYNDFIEPKK